MMATLRNLKIKTSTCKRIVKELRVVLGWRQGRVNGPRDTTGRLNPWMATLRNLKIKTSTCKRIVKELRSYEKEVEKEAAKTADMKDKGADPYDLKQQENVLAESRMMVPDCHKRLETALADLKATLAELKESNEQGAEIGEAESTIAEVEAVVKPTEE